MYPTQRTRYITIHVSSYASAGHLAVRGVRHLTVLAELRVCALGVKP